MRRIRRRERERGGRCIYSWDERGRTALCRDRFLLYYFEDAEDISKILRKIRTRSKKLRAPHRARHRRCRQPLLAFELICDLAGFSKI